MSLFHAVVKATPRRAEGFRTVEAFAVCGSVSEARVETHRNHIGLVSSYDEAETFVVQHDFMHLSINIPNDDLSFQKDGVLYGNSYLSQY